VAVGQAREELDGRLAGALVGVAALVEDRVGFLPHGFGDDSLDLAFDSLFARLVLPGFALSHVLAEIDDVHAFGCRVSDEAFDGRVYEAYGEMVGSTEPAGTRKFLEYLSKDRIKGHWDCPCGSGKKLRKCHMVHLLALQSRICPRIAKMALKRLSDQSGNKT